MPRSGGLPPRRGRLRASANARRPQGSPAVARCRPATACSSPGLHRTTRCGFGSTRHRCGSAAGARTCAVLAAVDAHSSCTGRSPVDQRSPAVPATGSRTGRRHSGHGQCRSGVRPPCGRVSPSARRTRSRVASRSSAGHWPSVPNGDGAAGQLTGSTTAAVLKATRRSTEVEPRHHRLTQRARRRHSRPQDPASTRCGSWWGVRSARAGIRRTLISDVAPYGEHHTKSY